MDVTYLSDILKKVSENSMDVDTALESLKHLPYEDIGYANIDQHRNLRTGEAEVIFGQGKTPEQIAGIVVSVHSGWQTNVLRLVPQRVVLGIGCRRGTAQETIEAAVAAVLSAHQLDPSAVKGVYSIDLKQQEAGLLAACAKHNWPTVFYTAEELRSVPGEFTDSPFVQEMTGVGNVCERAAMRGAEKLLVKKTAVDGVTVAVAAEHWEVSFG